MREEIKARGMKDERKKEKERKRRVFCFGYFLGGWIFCIQCILNLFPFNRLKYFLFHWILKI